MIVAKLSLVWWELCFLDFWFVYYRPQRSCEGYFFTPVCHSVHRGGVCLSTCWDTTPPKQTPPGKHTNHPPPQEAPLWKHTPPRKQTLPQEAHPPAAAADGTILLECILVLNLFVRKCITSRHGVAALEKELCKVVLLSYHFDLVLT